MSGWRMPTALALVAPNALSLAALVPSAASPTSAATAPPIAQDNDTCLACHSAPGQTVSLPSGEALYVSVDPQVFEQSVHGEEGLACLDCHPGSPQIPHTPLTAQTRREYVLQRYAPSATTTSTRRRSTPFMRWRWPGGTRTPPSAPIATGPTTSSGSARPRAPRSLRLASAATRRSTPNTARVCTGRP